MKRVTAIAATMTLALLLAACGQSDAKGSPDGGDTDTDTDTPEGWELIYEAGEVPDQLSRVVTTADGAGHFFCGCADCDLGAAAAVPLWTYDGADIEVTNSVRRIPYRQCETMMFADGDGLIAAGCGGVAAFDGTSWTQLREDTMYTAIWGADDGTVFLSTGGDVLKDDGAGPTATTGSAQVGIDAVWGVSSNQVYGVGHDGVFSRFDGVSWTALPSPSTTERLEHIWGAGSNEIYTAADGSLYRWNGAAWSAFSLGEGEHPVAVDGVASNDVYVLTCSSTEDGLSLASKLFHFDGAAVTLVEETPYCMGEMPIQNLEVLDSGHVFTIALNMSTGALTLEEVGGGASIPLSPLSFSDLDELRLSGTGPDDIHLLSTFQGVAAHYDGTAWTDVSVDTGGGFSDVSGVGSLGARAAVTNNGAYLTWDGAAWTVQEDGSCNIISDLTGTGADDVYIRCHTGSAADARWYHYDGAVWSVIDDPVWDGINDMLFFEEDRAIGMSYDNAQYYGIWDGATWSMEQVTGVSFSGYHGLWGTDIDDVYAYNNSYSWTYRFDGVGWSQVDNGSDKGTHCMSGSSSQDVIAVGTEGQARHYDGAAWTGLDFGTDESLISVCANPTGTAYILGADGSIWRRAE